MKIKGFTLLEMLAVIALLSLLVLLAFPIVLGTFRTTEKRAFIMDARAIFNVAKDEILTLEEIISNNKFCYSDSEYDNKLEFIEKTGVYYNIEFNNSYIVAFEISTDKYYLIVENSEGIKVSDLKEDNVILEGELGYKQVTCEP